MAVEASVSGGGGAGEELLSMDEMEVKREREIGGDFEHIACRDGNENDGSGTDGSFVMVMSGGDSDSTEKEIDFDVGGGAGDPPQASGAQPPAEDSGSSAFVVDENDDGEGVGKEERKKGDSSLLENVEKADELGGGEDGQGAEEIEAEEEKVQVPEDMPVVSEEGIVESTRTDHDHKEEGELICEVLENDKKQKQNEEVAIEVSKKEGQNQGEEEVVVVKDSNDDKERVIEDLSSAEEKVVYEVPKNDEQNQSEEGVLVVEDSKEEKETITEDLNNEVGAAVSVEEQVSEGMKASCEHNGTGIVCEGLTNGAASVHISSPYPVTGDLEVQSAQSVLEEMEDVEPSASQPSNNEIETVFVIEERNKAIGEKSGAVQSSFVEQKDANSAFEIERRREEAADEIGKVIVSSVTEPTKGEVHSASDIEVGRNANDEESKDIECSVTEPAKKVVDSNSEIEIRKGLDDGRSKDVETSTNHVVEEVGSAASDVGVGKTADHDISNCDDRENERRLAIQAEENQQINSSVTVSNSIEGDLKSSVEETEQHNVNRSLSKCEIEENGLESSAELISEPFEENTDSASIVEEYQVAEDSYIDREIVKEDTSLATQAEDIHAEALDIASNVGHVEELGSASEARENQSANPKEGMVLDSEVEPKDMVGSFTDLSPKPIQEHMPTFEVEENHDADDSFIALKPKPIVEVSGSDSKADENLDAEASITKGGSEKPELQSNSGLADVEKQPVEDMEVTEDLHEDMKSDEELMTEPGNAKRVLRSAADFDEPAKIHPEKGLGEIEEQQKDLKSKDRHAAEQNQLQQDIAAPSPSDGDAEKAEKYVKKHYIIKVPRFTQRLIDDERQNTIDKAQLQVDQKTQSRNSIMSELKNMRKALSDCCRKRDSAMEEEKKAKALLNAKRQEMDSFQSVISKGKTAASFVDIISQIHTLEHKIQHETISLKEEKKYLNELNHLKHERELHLFNKCSQQEIDEAHKQKEIAESSLRPLKKEFDLLKSVHSKADEHAKAASRSYIVLFNKIKEHEQKWKEANELRQIAYKNFDVLKSDKVVHYRKYIDDKQSAKNYASSRDFEALETHCAAQVERILQLWNEDVNFRRHYVESNVSSTLRRFGTFDGRTLGLNEEPVVLPSHVPPPSTTRNLATPVIVHEEQMPHAHGVRNSPQLTKQVARSKLSSKATLTKNVPVIASEEIVEVEAEKEFTKEEDEQARLAEEQARKEEELRKERVAAEFKERLKMEQKAKAKEAEERKRRKAEKAQARAEYRAQKEAEIREQKKAKKEKKREGISEATTSIVGESAVATETSPHVTDQEPESNAGRTSKKSTRQTAAALNKYSSRIQPVPLHLRNKGKRKTSTWVWPLCAVAAVGGLFFAGNYISFSNISLLDFGF